MLIPCPIPRPHPLSSDERLPLTAVQESNNQNPGYEAIDSVQSTDVKEHPRDIEEKLKALSLQGARVSNKDAERKQIQRENDSTKRYLAICAQASKQADQGRTNSFEDVSAAQGAHQVIAVTLGDIISAKQVTT